MKEPLVSIIITNWNGKPHLTACLTSLSKITYKDIEIILIDNGSRDGSVAYVRKNFPKVRIIPNKEDLGFCKGNNQGYKIAKGKYILMLNNDTTVERTFLNPLVAAMENDPTVGIVQPKIVFMISKMLQSGCTYFTWTGFLYYTGYHKNPKDPRYNQTREMYSANGSCMLVRKSVIDEIGFLDEDFFSYFEETDFCHRAQIMGYRVIYEPKGIIHHIGSADNKKEKTYRIQNNAFRNRITSYLKNLSLPSLVIIMPLHTMVNGVYVVFNIFKGRWDYARAVLDAYILNIKNIKLTLRKRAVIQHARKVSDSKLFQRVLKYPRMSYYYYLTTDLRYYPD